MELNGLAGRDGHVPAQEKASEPRRRRGRIGRFLRSVANAVGLLVFSARLTLGRQGIVLAVVAVAFFAVGALGGGAWSAKGIFHRLLLIQTLFFVILTMGLLPREKEWRTLEVLLVSARTAHRLVLLKFVPVCVFVFVAGFGLTIGFYWLLGGFQFARMLLVSYGLAALVGMLTLVLSTYLRNPYAAGVVALVVATVVSMVWIDPWESVHGELISVSAGRRGSGDTSVRTSDNNYSGRRRGGPRRGPPDGYRGRSRGRSSGGFSSRYRASRPGKPNLTGNRIVLVILFGFLYDYAVRRMRRLELWMK